MPKVSTPRSSNFTFAECQLLARLVKEFANVIECKKSDVNIWGKKVAAWKKISEKFNAENVGDYRDYETLRRKYENIKKCTKKKFSDEKCHARGTGGGAPKPSNITSFDSEILEILKVQVQGLPSEFDDDAEDFQIPPGPAESQSPTSNSVQVGGHVSPTNSEIMIEIYDQDNMSEENILNSTLKTNWSAYTPSDLRRPKSVQLVVPKATTVTADSSHVAAETKLSTVNATSSYRTHIPQKSKLKATRSTASEKWVEVAKTKSELVSLQIQCLREDHDSKMKQQAEEHNTKMKQQAEEHNTKMKQLAEEHDLKCKLLKAQIGLTAPTR